MIKEVRKGFGYGSIIRKKLKSCISQGQGEFVSIFNASLLNGGIYEKILKTVPMCEGRRKKFLAKLVIRVESVK